MSKIASRSKKTIKLEDDYHCFVCGRDNPVGLKLKFVLAGGIMTTEFTPAKIHQGFANVVHGGIIATVLDEIMLNRLFKGNIYAVTAQLEVRFKKPARVGEKLYFSSWITDDKGKLIETAAQAKNQRGEIVAQASAKCFVVSKKEA